MASSVFYKWASRKDESRITFDGTGISVFDLKRDIILANNMSKATDFDLVVLDANTKQEYADDVQIIPRSSSVVVKRVPASRPGKGKAPMYTAGVGGLPGTSQSGQSGGGNSWQRGSMSKRFDGKDDGVKAMAPSNSIKPSGAQDDEAAAMAAMFEFQAANWEETQEKMSHAQRVYNNPRGTGFPARGGKPFTPAATQRPQEADRPLPASYVCYRCGQKGHWIKDCPTNADRDYDHRPRIKRTTGIPRSMLKVVENPTHEQLGQGVMVTPEGGYVVAQPDSAAWQKQVSRPKGLTAVEIRERPPTDPSLACPIDHKLFREAVKTPCCGTSYSEENIQTHLLERDFICPHCGQKVASLDKLVPDKPMRIKVADYIEKAIEESNREEETLAKSSVEGLETVNLEQDFYSDQQPGSDMDFQQMLIDNIPQLQAQIQQITIMLQNPSLPNQVRLTTEMQHHQLKLQLEQAQTMSAAIAFQQQFQAQNANAGFMQQAWSNVANQQQPAVNNRRRIQKRDRPSDFFDISGEGDSKVPRYWE